MRLERVFCSLDEHSFPNQILIQGTVIIDIHKRTISPRCTAPRRIVLKNHLALPNMVLVVVLWKVNWQPGIIYKFILAIW